MRALLTASCVMLSLFAGSLRADLQTVKAEPNLEKRSKLAMENADRALKEARAAYAKGEFKETETAIAEVQESVELAVESLRETGKNPRKSPKWFKRTEIETRDLLRKLDNFRDEMSVVDRPPVEKAIAKIQHVHDELLSGVMEGKSK